MALALDRAAAGLRIDCAIAEAQTVLDRWPGGMRDLLVTGDALGRRITIGLEGTA